MAFLGLGEAPVDLGERWLVFELGQYAVGEGAVDLTLEEVAVALELGGGDGPKL